MRYSIKCEYTRVVPETTTGGNALKFYASVRMDVRRIETLKDGDVAVANKTRVKIVKNKMAPPFKQCEFDIEFGKGISREGGLIDLGVAHDFVKKAGTWYSYGDERIGQGRDNAIEYLRSNPAIAKELDAKIRAKLLPEETGAA